jgi:hypothetical protein
MTMRYVKCKHDIKYSECEECSKTPIGWYPNETIIPPSTWEQRFRKTAFAQGGGLAFECSDYDGMYLELVVFIAQEISRAREEDRTRLTDRVRDYMGKYDRRGTQYLSEGYDAACMDILKLLTPSVQGKDVRH